MKKIFLGGLPKSVTDEHLRELFTNYGHISDFVVMRDPITKESRGFGFVEFVDEEPVNKVLKSRPHIIEGREIEVRRAMPKEITHNTIHERTRRVFIGGLNYDVTEDMLKNYYSEKFSKYGKVESVEVKRDRETNQPRGFAFITFDTEDAVDAVLIMEPKPSQFGRNCEVKKSEPRRSDDSYSRRRRNRHDRRRSPPPYRYRRDRYDDYNHYSSPRDYSRRGGRYNYSRETPYDRSPPRYRSYAEPAYVEPQPYPPRPYPYYNDYSSHEASHPTYSHGSVKPPMGGYNPRPVNPPFTRGQVPPRHHDGAYHAEYDSTLY